jgi:oligoribonuclease NrnB/cAMP/cGMP phosphodiesterase (DHH superfamily)
MKMKNVLIIHHRIDLDGWMSGAIAKLFFTHQKDTNITTLGFNYGDDFTEDLSVYDEIVMTDISIDGALMKEYEDKLLIIDHHESAVRNLEKYNISPGVGVNIDMVHAACELAWDYFYPEHKMPELVRYLGLYDSFRHKTKSEEIQKKTMSLQYGARAYIDDLPSAFDYLVGVVASPKSDAITVNRLIAAGEAIFKYQCTMAKPIYATRKDSIFELDGKQLKFACFNATRFNPSNFNINYHADGYDVIFTYYYNGTQWICSFYNDNGKVNVSKIAELFGGGGHAGASGCQFEVFEDIASITGQ